MAARVICMRRLAVAAALLVGVPAVLISTGGCAGYRFGNNTLYAPNVRTVYVPMIQSESFRTTPGIDLGERLTEAVCKEIEKRTPFKVVGSDGAADSVLTARIVADTKRMVVESPTDQSRSVQMNYQTLVTWADRGGTVIAGRFRCRRPPSTSASPPTSCRNTAGRS